MKLFSLLEVKYQEFENAVRTYLSSTLSKYGENYGNSTIFGQLINVVGSMVQNLISYIEDSLTEQNKYTAQRKKSIYSLAALSGYNPSLGKAASCNIKLTFKPNTAINQNIIINNKTKLLCAYNGLIYNIILPQEAIVYSLDNDKASKYLQIIEGQYQVQTFYADGAQLFSKNIPFSGDTDIDYLEVYVNNELWERVESLYDMQPYGHQYVIKTSLTKGFDIFFGNDEFGQSLSSGDKVEVRYLLHSGELGNLNGNVNNIYFTFSESLFDVLGNEVNGNEIFNIDLVDDKNINSGTYSETTSLVKQMIGYNSRALVLADPKNYNTFINKFSFCGYNRTWCEPGSLLVNSLIMKNYKTRITDGQEYFSLKESDFILNDEQKRTIQNYIANSGNQLAGVTYNIIDPKLCKYAAYIYIKPKTMSYDKDLITSKIKKLIGEFMADVNSDIFIPKSDLIHLLKSNIDEIDGVNIYFLSEKNETAILNKKYILEESIYNPNTGTYETTTKTVYLEEGEDPGLGLDSHGNIYLTNDKEFPVLMGGWSFISTNNSLEKQTTTITDPLIIVFE